MEFKNEIKAEARRRLAPGQFFVNLGANDGVTGDPLHQIILDYDMAGLAVEPNPAAVRELRKTFASHPGVIIEEAAIALTTGRVGLYILDVPDEEFRRASHLSSLDPDYHARNLPIARAMGWHEGAPPDLEERVKCIDVEGYTIEDLLSKHGVTRVDVINVHVESLDYEILSTIDLERLQPRLLAFSEAGMSDEEKQALESRLTGIGYEHLQRWHPFRTVWGIALPDDHNND